MRGERKAKRNLENAKVADLENLLLLLQLFRNLAISFLRTENAEHVQMPRYRIEAMTLEKLKEPELSVCPWQTNLRRSGRRDGCNNFFMRARDRKRSLSKTGFTNIDPFVI